jgi:sugar lactone lactonase YvrE
MKLNFGLLDLEEQDEIEFLDVSDAAIDESGRILLLTRRSPAVVIYEPDGAYVGAWGQDLLVLPHGITMGPDGLVYVVDQGAHAVRIFDLDGEPRGVLGTPGKPSDTGVDWSLPAYKDRYLSIDRGGPPFNNPTALAFADDGSFYVSDGYGNTRVHHFGVDRELLRSWGEPGSGSGEFRLPHHVCVSCGGMIFAADRENDRVQCFDAGGTHVATWSDVQRPAAMVEISDNVFVVGELAWTPGAHRFMDGEVADKIRARISVIGADGEVLARSSPDQTESIHSPHGLAVGANGTIYVAQLAAGLPEPVDPITSIVTVSLSGT